MTTSSCWVGGYISSPSPTVQSTPVRRTVEEEEVVMTSRPVVMTTSSCWVGGYISSPSPTVQSTPVRRTVEEEEVVMTSRPVVQEGHCFFSYQIHLLITNSFIQSRPTRAYQQE